MQISIQVNATTPAWLRTKTRRKTAALALALALVVPGLALASHQFSDVPDSNSFHGNIARVYGARITAGCGPDIFCPDATVTRGQMSAFLARAVGRVAFDDIGYYTINGTETTPGSVTIRAGDVTGGYARVLVHVDLNAYSYDNPSDAVVHVVLYHGGSSLKEGWLQVAKQSAALYGNGSLSVSYVVTVPTGVDQTLSVKTQRLNGTAVLTGYGSITASYVPFTGSGGNPAVVLLTEDHGGKGDDPPK